MALAPMPAPILMCSVAGALWPKCWILWPGAEMKDYLIFQLYGPLASWGEIAVGEVRPSAAYPSRSALLGLLAAALGVERGEGAALAALAEAYRFGVKLHWEGQVLRDYHTVQRGPALRKHTYRTRRQELG